MYVYTQLHRPQEGPHSTLTEPLHSAGHHPCGGQQWSLGVVCPSRPTDSSQGGGQWAAPADNGGSPSCQHYVLNMRQRKKFRNIRTRIAHAHSMPLANHRQTHVGYSAGCIHSSFTFYHYIANQKMWVGSSGNRKRNHERFLTESMKGAAHIVRVLCMCVNVFVCVYMHITES